MRSAGKKPVEVLPNREEAVILASTDLSHFTRISRPEHWMRTSSNMCGISP